MRRARHRHITVRAGLEIRLNGRNQTQSEHIKLGAYHTLEVELHRPFTVTKEAWDKLDLLRVKQATDPAASADLAVLLITVRCSQAVLHGCAAVLHSAARTACREQGCRLASWAASLRCTCRLLTRCAVQEGLANLLLLGTHSVTSKSKIEASVPSKGAKGAKGAFSAKVCQA